MRKQLGCWQELRAVKQESVNPLVNYDPLCLKGERRVAEIKQLTKCTKSLDFLLEFVL